MTKSIDKQEVETNTKKVTWYEKTVEYAFARKFLEAEAMPLSGTAEKVGDTIFYAGKTFYIVEFKRGLDVKAESKKEQEKYGNSIKESAQKILKNEVCMSHYVVLGYVDKEQRFGIKAQYYIGFIAEEYLKECLEQYKKCLKECLKGEECLNEESLKKYEEDLKEYEEYKEHEEYLERCNEPSEEPDKYFEESKKYFDEHEKCLEESLEKYGLYRHIRGFLYEDQDGNLGDMTKPWVLSSNCTDFRPVKDLEKLKTYLQLLIDEKKSSSNDSSSVDYGNILIVDKDGNACALSNREGLQKLELKFPTNTHSSTYSPKPKK